jgi:ABC-2 type transport system ATP-binding protein
MLDQTGLRDRRDDPVSKLSGGTQQRVNIAIGLIAQPVALLLDEPSAGLDPGQRERLWEFVLDLAGAGTTVLFSTHNIAEAERYGHRLLVIADGEALFDGPPRALHEAVVAGAEGNGEQTVASFEHAFVSFLKQRGH